MKPIPHRHHAAGKRKIRRRLDRPVTAPSPQPVLTAANIQYEVAHKTRAISCGGIGAIHLLVRKLGLAEAIDERLHLLRFHFPYHESDHVLNFAYNALCNGSCLDDMELRRNDLVFLDALGADRIPDPTTAGDFCRRFSSDDVETLQDVFDQTRLKVWHEQPSDFFDEAVLDVDGTLVATGACCKQGVTIAYDGTWGYHPLIISLANTGEVLSIVNRSGNRPSHEGAAEQLDPAILLCRQAGFRRVYLRGDTDFSQTTQLDAWDAEHVTFLFGIDAMPNLKALAEDLPATAWSELQRPPQYQAQGPPRQRPERVKDAIVRQHGFKDLIRLREDVAEVAYRPTACHRTYRLIIVRQTIAVEKGQARLFDEIRYRFYLTNDRHPAARALVFKANDRCHQEDLIAQLKGGVHALRAAVDNLVSNWAYMVMTALAWNLKAWWALQVPEHPRHKEQHREQKRRLLGMEFKRFVNPIIQMPCQIVRGGRRLVNRLLSWNEWQGVFLRTVQALQC
ncbi:MAG: IS1380 family transposase [Planctomycetaceae bacterium]|nr:IS1380 family transposase [Planctomycetaceae bacterium]